MSCESKHRRVTPNRFWSGCARPASSVTRPTRTSCGCSCPAMAVPESCSRWPPRSAFRCATSVPASRRSRTSSRTRWVKNESDSRSGLPALWWPEGAHWDRLDGHRPCGHSKPVGEAGVSRAAVAVVPAVLRPRDSDLPRGEFSADRGLARGETGLVPPIPRSAADLGLLHHGVRRCWFDCQRSGANALQIYLSKPLTRAEYIFGKLAILMAFLLLVTWVPALLLLIVQIAFAGNFTFLLKNLYLFPAITVFAFIQVTMVAAAMLALSSLSKSSRYVAILYAAVIFFSQAIYGVLTVVTRSTQLSWISFPANLSQMGDVFFRMPSKYDTPWPVALLMIVGLIAVSGLILERRVRGIEVVA